MEDLRKETQNLIVANITSISLFLEYEDGTEDATLADLDAAFKFASEEELRQFLKSHYVPYDGGYIYVRGIK